MQVILLENIKNLGKFGHKVSVANGYGRNFLIPNGKAVPATKENLVRFESQRAELEQAAQSKLLAAQERAASLSAVHLKLSMLAGEEGKLYGSIGTVELVNAFKDKGFEVARQEIRLPNGTIRELGEYEVAVQLHAEVGVMVKVTVMPQEN